MVKITRGGLALLGGTALVITFSLAMYFQTLKNFTMLRNQLDEPEMAAGAVRRKLQDQEGVSKERDLHAAVPRKTVTMLRNQLDEPEMAAGAVRRKLQDQEGESKECDLHAAVPRKTVAMLDSDVVLPAALGRSFVDMSVTACSHWRYCNDSLPSVGRLR